MLSLFVGIGFITILLIHKNQRSQKMLAGQLNSTQPVLTPHTTLLLFEPKSTCTCRDQRAMPLMVDPGLYETKKSDIFWVQPDRPLPTAFKLFTGKFSHNH